MEAETEDYSPTYRYFRSKLQRMQEQLRQIRENQRGMAAIVAEYMAGPNSRTQYSSYEDARNHYLDQIAPSDAFRDEAVQIFQQVWEQSAP